MTVDVKQAVEEVRREFRAFTFADALLALGAALAVFGGVSAVGAVKARVAGVPLRKVRRAWVRVQRASDRRTVWVAKLAVDRVQSRRGGGLHLWVRGKRESLAVLDTPALRAALHLR